MGVRSVLKRVGREEAGMTLVEMLVVMIIAIITTIALFSFQDLVLRQSNRVFARVDATQDARTAMEKIQTRLHSACIAEDVIPIRVGSDQDTLKFISRYGSAAALVPQMHVLQLTGTTLTDSTHALVSGSSPGTWVFSETALASPAPQKILTAVSVPPGKTAFTYYPYGIARDSGGNAYIDSAGNPYIMLLDGLSTLPSNVRTSTGGAVANGTMPANSPSPLAVPLDQTGANAAAAVAINLLVDADGGLGANPNNSNAPITISDSVVMRITPVPSDNNQGVPKPCE
jgi:type II secretory pathway pseudopilin PulG